MLPPPDGVRRADPAVWRAVGTPIASGSMPEGRHRSTSRVVLIGVGIAVVAAVAVAAVLLGGGTSVVSRSTPEFSFTVDKAIGTSLEPGVKDRDVSGRADTVAAEIAPTLDLLYAAAFLDPENWTTGTYDAVWDLFDAEARPTALASASTLTLGDLGARFDDVQPDRGTFDARVLFDAAGAPTLVAVQVTFRAIATPGADPATSATIVSRGEFLLERSATGWTIVAFRVDREDENLPAAEASA